MPYQVGKCSASVTYNKHTYKLIGVDSYTLNDATKTTKIFPKDGLGAGITQKTGDNLADSIVLNATYLPEAVQNLLFAIHDDAKGHCTLTITDSDTNASNTHNRIVLDFATVESKLFQQQIDDSSISKYKITFNGKLKKTESSFDSN